MPWATQGGTLFCGLHFDERSELPVKAPEPQEALPDQEWEEPQPAPPVKEDRGWKENGNDERVWFGARLRWEAMAG